MSLPSELLPVGLLGTGAAAEAEGYTIERSVRFNSSDSAYLGRDFISDGDRKTWTWAGWVKRSVVSSGQQTIFGSYDGSSGAFTRIGFQSNDVLWFQVGGSGGVYRNITSAVYRDPGAWLHLVATLDTTQATASDRVRLWVNGVLQVFGTTSYPTLNYAGGHINQGIWHAVGAEINDSTVAASSYFSGYLADIHFIDGQALDPTSFGEFDDNGIWQPIEYTGTYGTNGFHLDFSDNSSAAALGYDAAGSNDWTVNNISPGSLVDYTTNIDLVNGDPIRSTDNIYDIFDGNTSTGAETNDGTGNSLLFDFANGTGSIPVSSNIQVWVGGSDGRTLKVNGSVIATNTSIGNNPHTITGQSQLDSVEVVSEASNRSGFLFQIAVDGTALVSFPGKDNDSLVDVPTNGTETDTGVGGEVRGNYCTINPIASNTNNSYTNGNLDTSCAASVEGVMLGTIGVSSGKWYFECTATTLNASSQTIGVANQTVITSASGALGVSAGGWSIISTNSGNNGKSYNNGAVGPDYGTISQGDVVGVAFDIDAAKVWFSINGTWLNSGVPASGTGAIFTNLSGTTIFPAASNYNGGALTFNFGQRPFAYTAPSGFKALCTANLPTPAVTKPSEYMDIALYTGNGSTQTISGLGFSPDLVWIKVRSTTYFHRLFDTVRPLNAAIFPSSTNAEVTSTLNDNFTSFNSDGFSLGATSSTNGSNANGQTFVAWTWDAGDSTVTNTDGSITSTVRANATAGFSVVTGTTPATNTFTIGHGLGVEPHFIIVKVRNQAYNWDVYHKTLGNTGRLVLNLTNAVATFANAWGSTTPTSTVFTMGGNGTWYSTGDTFVAYCFAPVDGYSAFGSYTGNGSATDGPFVFTNHRPRWILLKRTDTTSNWTIIDTAREGYNVDNDPLYPNLNNAEGTTDLADILSNGFKLRSADASVNANAGTYIYASFAESPFQYSRAR